MAPSVARWSGAARVAFDPNAGAQGTSIIEFATTLDDADTQCADWMNQIGVVASYRREQDDEWLTAESVSSGAGQYNAAGKATVPGRIVDADVFHRSSFSTTRAAFRPIPGAVRSPATSRRTPSSALASGPTALGSGSEFVPALFQDPTGA